MDCELSPSYTDIYFCILKNSPDSNKSPSEDSFILSLKRETDTRTTNYKLIYT